MLKQSGIAINNTDSMISYLPLAHIFGRIIEEFALSVGGSVGYWQVMKSATISILLSLVSSIRDGLENKRTPNLPTDHFHQAQYRK